MALSTCDTITDPHGRELLEHGTAAFPVACYCDSPTNDEVPWHWHDELEAIVITKGTTVVATGGGTFPPTDRPAA